VDHRIRAEAGWGSRNRGGPEPDAIPENLNGGCCCDYSERRLHWPESENGENIARIVLSRLLSRSRICFEFAQWSPERNSLGQSIVRLGPGRRDVIPG